jgi:SNF2 family DNA or RNA helicase
MPAVGLAEQRNELSRTTNERCEMVAQLVNGIKRPFVCWVNRNAEGDLLERLIPESVQVSGDDSDEQKEEYFRAFEAGEVRVMVTKPTIAGFGLNWQHCANQTFFPSHSFEQWYQAIRRSWRFGQTQPVTIDVISTEGQSRVLANLQRKAAEAERMFSKLVEYMNDENKINETNKHTKQASIPTWL